MLGLDNLNSRATPPAQPVCAVNIHISPGFAFPAVWNIHWWVPRAAGDNMTDCPRRGNTLSSHLAGLMRGFIDAGSAGRRAVSRPSTLRGAFPVSLRWSHHYSQVNNRASHLASLTGLSPRHPSSSLRAWERAPSAGTERAVSKCKADILINYLETWVQFISTLLPAQEVSKVVIVPMKSHSYCGLSGLTLFAVYEIPQWIPFSRFQVSGSTLPLFQGDTKTERNVENIYCESRKLKFWVTV